MKKRLLFLVVIIVSICAVMYSQTENESRHINGIIYRMVGISNGDLDPSRTEWISGYSDFVYMKREGIIWTVTLDTNIANLTAHITVNDRKIVKYTVNGLDSSVQRLRNAIVYAMRNSQRVPDSSNLLVWTYAYTMITLQYDVVGSNAVLILESVSTRL
jgi:hypothetical protein